MRTLTFGRMVMYIKKQISVDLNFWSNGRATKERLNERGLHIFVEWSCAYKRN